MSDHGASSVPPCLFVGLSEAVDLARRVIGFAKSAGKDDEHAVAQQSLQHKTGWTVPSTVTTEVGGDPCKRKLCNRTEHWRRECRRSCPARTTLHQVGIHATYTDK